MMVMRRAGLVRFTLSLLIVVFAACSGCVSRAPGPGTAQARWWQNAVFYEIYPRSFADTNGDGVGDLNGITEHLDYLADLGIDAIWITPFYPSPQVDFGYDISDYRSIDPQYGTLDDFDRLVAEAKKRNIRVLCDLVLNHTSDKHPWFIESRSSRTNPKADWYIWVDGKPDGQPPNNWQSLFGHSAWQWDDQRKQFYYHEFYKEQPDLNWRNPEVRKAMYGVARFWMQHGAAGFRLDAITTLFEDQKLRDEPVLPGTDAFGEPRVTRQYTDNLPEVHNVLRELRQATDQYPGRVLVGETYMGSIAELARMYGRNNDEIQLPMDIYYGFSNRLNADDFRQRLAAAESELKGQMPLLVFDNHDQRRSWDRYGDGAHDEAIAKAIATLLLTPRATALLYYGQEIGMQNNDPKTKADVRDPMGRTGWPREIGRDGERTPMQWNAGQNAGFSDAASTWLPVGPNFRLRNVAIESHEPNSLLSYYKTLIQLKRENAALHSGSLTIVDKGNPSVLSYLRRMNGEVVVVSINLTPTSQTVRPDLAAAGVKGTTLKSLACSFDSQRQFGDAFRIELPPFGAFVGEVQ